MSKDGQSIFIKVSKYFFENSVFNFVRPHNISNKNYIAGLTQNLYRKIVLFKINVGHKHA